LSFYEDGAEMKKAVERVSVVASSGFGSGYSRIVPGTCGTAACLVAWYLIFTLLDVHSLFVGAAVAVGVTGFGTMMIAGAMRANPGVSDPQWIVLDEWAGMLVALIGIYPENIKGVLLAFVLFRLFDMWKPGPVGWAERLPGPIGVMADDVVAGTIALGLGHLALLLW